MSSTRRVKYIDSSCVFVDDADHSKKMYLELSEIAADTTRTITFPDADTLLVGTDCPQTLTNKDLIDNSIMLANNSDDTKKAQFNLGNITAGTTRTITIPDTNLTLVGTTAIQTLTNKTITNPIISSISNGGTIYFPNGNDTLVGLATSDQLSNKSLKNNTVFHVDASDISKKIGFSSSGASTGTTMTIASSHTANRTLTLPNTTDTLVGKATTDILTNKIIDDNSNTVTADKLRSATSTITISSATAPTSGQVLTATSGTAATWQTPSGGGGKDAYYQYIEDLSQTSTTSSSYVQRMRLTTGTIPAGTYRIGWHYVWRISTTSNNFIARIHVNDTTTVHYHEQEIKDRGNDIRQSNSGFHHIVLTNANHTIDLDYTRESGTAYIYESRLEFWKVA